MDIVPKRRTLLAETIAVLRGAIDGGEWESLLPGERTLCRQMQVGRDTLRAAIHQLEREGLIAPGEPGRQRRIISANRPRSVEEKTRVIALLTPHRLESFSETMLLWVEILRERLASTGYRLDLVSNRKVFGLERPSKVLENLTTNSRAGVWILHQTTAPIQRWFAERGPPCILHGQAQDVDLPAIDIDYAAVGRHAGGALIGRGHRHVAMLRPRAELKGLDMAELGLREAFARHPGEALSQPQIWREPEGNGKRAVVSFLERLLHSEPRPTALVLTRTNQVLTCISWLATQRIRIPEELSLVALDYSPFFDQLVPEISCYRSDSEATARIVHRKVLEIADSGAPCSSHLLMPDFCPGASIAGKL